MLTNLKKYHAKVQLKPHRFLDKPRIDIVNVYRSLIGGDIKKVGSSLMVKCLFHDEKTPSMVLYPKTSSFFCFGCEASGTAFDLIMKAENCDFKESLEIAKRL